MGRMIDKEKIVKILEWTGAVLFIILALFMAVSGFVSLSGVGSVKVDLSKYASIHYTGFETKGVAELTLDKGGIEKEMELCFAKYESGVFPIFKNHTNDEYIALGRSIEGIIDKNTNLKNGDEINILFSYDEELADDLSVKFENTLIPVTVEDLKDGRAITEEELFENLKFSVEGISPVIKVSVKNGSKDPFISSVEYVIIDEENCYKNGDNIVVEARLDEEKAKAENIDISSGVYKKEYQINGFEEYVGNVSQIPQSVFKEAVEEGKTYFGDALDYGLRIFTEANLYPDFSKGYEFSDPELISAYLEVIKDPSMTSATKPYNYLELCYNVYLSQPGGKGCMAEAIVCFSNLKIDTKGECVLDKSTGKLFSASHNDSSIKKSLNEWFGSDYDVEKFEQLPE